MLEKITTQIIRPKDLFRLGVCFSVTDHVVFSRELFCFIHLKITFLANLAIWLANLPLPIRVHTTLLASMCRAMPFSARALKKKFLWRWYCGKTQIKMWFIVVCTLIDNEYASLLFSPNFFLRIVSACKFLTGKSDAYKELICIIVARALSRSESVTSWHNLEPRSPTARHFSVKQSEIWVRD